MNTSFLTKRELEVYSLISDGLTNKQIAINLNISLTTARNHIYMIFRKLRVNNRVQAVLMKDAVATQIRQAQEPF